MSRFRSLALDTAVFLVRVLTFSLGTTCRLTMAGGGERLEEVFRRRRPVILACWHNQLFFLLQFRRSLLHRGLPFTALVSRSRDGELAARLGLSIGCTVLRGSTSRGGAGGLRQLCRAVGQGSACVVIPDGPRGPRYEAKPGAVMLAQMTGAPILPVGFAASRRWTLRSWDRFRLPKPFARVAMAVGEPIEVPRGLPRTDLEGARKHLEEALQQVSAEAAAHFAA